MGFRLVRVLSGFLYTANLFFSCNVVAQQVGNLASPPLQYIKLSTQGDKPPALKNAAIGYDETSRSLIIFGGESNGFPQSQTYLLNLDTLTWSLPTPPSNLRSSPPARSNSIYGSDFAASNRHSFVVIGGKGDDNKGLSDVWAFDWNNKFWAQVQLSPGGPSARWGAAGGNDFRVDPHQDSSGVAGPNNTLYLTGGTDGSQPFTDGLWALELAGTLSSNLPDSVVGSWTRTSLNNFPSLHSLSGTVLSKKVVTVGTCNSTSSDACPLQEFQVIDAESKSFSPYQGCPAPRIDAVLVPNLNGASNSFSSQIFLLFGTYNVSAWEDSQGLENGEVDIMDVNIGSWSRVIPSGNPGTNGKAQYPSPRQGAAAFAYNQGLVGTQRTAYTDTLIFGGQDRSGNYLDDLWLLRSYNDRLTASNTTFKSGSLGSGVNADGAGVKVTFLTACATSKSTSGSPSSTSSTSSAPSSTSSSIPIDVGFLRLDAPTTHKVLSSLSIGLIVAGLVGIRLSPPPALLKLSYTSPPESLGHWGFIWYLLLAIGWGIGIAGLVSASTGTTASSSSSSAIARRDDDEVKPPDFLSTTHGKVGFVLSLCLYGVVPVLASLDAFLARRAAALKLPAQPDATSDEKPIVSSRGESPRLLRPVSPRIRTLSGQRSSEDSESTSSAGPSRGFQVLNRPTPRSRSSHATDVYSTASRQLGELDWLQRRRSLNAVGELDYAISQALRSGGPSTPAQEGLLRDAEPHSALLMPPLLTVILRILLHLIILALSILTLVALWYKAPRYAFALFLVWIVLFYVAVFVSSWRRLATRSMLTVMLVRLRGNSLIIPPTIPTGDANQASKETPVHSPYIHTPPQHVAQDPSQYPPGARSVEDDGSDEEDESSRQRRIEEEMDRRQVSIVTVPKRKLWVTNPELQP